MELKLQYLALMINKKIEMHHTEPIIASVLDTVNPKYRKFTISNAQKGYGCSLLGYLLLFFFNFYWPSFSLLISFVYVTPGF